MFNNRPKIIFYYPHHFNRTQGQNPFFQPMIEVCQQYRISYKVVEEPSKGSKAKRNLQSIRFDIYFFIVLILRKIIPLYFFKNFEFREQFIGKIINIISLGRFFAPVYITLSNSMGGLLKGINPNAHIFDYQHGIIPTTQSGYFNEHSATDLIKLNQKEVMVYGEGFRQSFLAVDPDYYFNKVHVIGKNKESVQEMSKGQDILVSLQIVESEKKPEKWFADQVALLHEQFSMLNSHYLKGRKVYLKCHPRSNLTYDISKLLQFPFVKMFDGNQKETDFALHITFFSTTAFDVAAFGIPSLFLYSDIIPEGKAIFIEEFNYPFGEISTIIDWLDLLEDENQREKIQKQIQEWYSYYYNPFDSDKFLKLINETDNN